MALIITVPSPKMGLQNSFAVGPHSQLWGFSLGPAEKKFFALEASNYFSGYLQKLDISYRAEFDRKM
jgi:hypothetical protein